VRRGVFFFGERTKGANSMTDVYMPPELPELGADLHKEAERLLIARGLDFETASATEYARALDDAQAVVGEYRKLGAGGASPFFTDPAAGRRALQRLETELKRRFGGSGDQVEYRLDQLAEAWSAAFGGSTAA
jgi:hypothetical protein